MDTTTRRKHEQEELRTKILDAARELFVSHGVEAVTMRKIADKIGYTATTLYNHFKDKEALLFALCDADFQALQATFRRMGRIADPIQRLRTSGIAYVEFAIRNPSHYRLMFMTPRPPRSAGNCGEIEKGNPDQDAYAFLRATVAEAIEMGLFRDEYQDPDLVAQVVWSGVHGVAALHLVLGEDTWCDFKPIESVAVGMIDVVIRGLLREKRTRGMSSHG